MTGDEIRLLRRKAGLSQAALGIAIGMSRESIGRMERGRDGVERRTELAVRYVAEVGTPEVRTREQIHEDVRSVLDDAAVRASPSIERTQKLKQALAEWIAAEGSETGRRLLYRAQGVIGMINVTDQSHATWSSTMRDLLELKREWTALRS